MYVYPTYWNGPTTNAGHKCEQLKPGKWAHVIVVLKRTISTCKKRCTPLKSVDCVVNNYYIFKFALPTYGRLRYLGRHVGVVRFHCHKCRRQWEKRRAQLVEILGTVHAYIHMRNIYSSCFRMHAHSAAARGAPWEKAERIQACQSRYRNRVGWSLCKHKFGI